MWRQQTKLVAKINQNKYGDYKYHHRLLLYLQHTYLSGIPFSRSPFLLKVGLGCTTCLRYSTGAEGTKWVGGTVAYRKQIAIAMTEVLDNASLLVRVFMQAITLIFGFFYVISLHCSLVTCIRGMEHGGCVYLGQQRKQTYTVLAAECFDTLQHEVRPEVCRTKAHGTKLRSI